MSKFKRILLKLSGESLMGKQNFGIDPERLSDYARQIKEVHEMGVQIGIVIGGGNIFRGLSGSQKGFDRVKGDQMGMCATVINSLALSSALGVLGVKTKVLTAIRMEPIGEFYTKWKAIEAMESGYVCIFSAGTGNPYFTTDTGSSLRGIEIEADVMLKGTRVDGIYTADPEKDPAATKFKEITYDEIYTRGLKVMDLTATTMCKENNLPIYVFNMDIVGNLKKVMDGEEIGTLVQNIQTGRPDKADHFAGAAFSLAHAQQGWRQQYPAMGATENPENAPAISWDNPEPQGQTQGNINVEYHFSRIKAQKEKPLFRHASYLC